MLGSKQRRFAGFIVLLMYLFRKVSQAERAGPSSNNTGKYSRYSSRWHISHMIPRGRGQGTSQQQLPHP